MAWWTRKPPTPEERKKQMEKLAEARDPRAVALVQDGLKDPDRDIRVHAVKCLGTCLVWGLGEFDWMLAALHDPDYEVRGMVATLAPSLDEQRAFEPVAALLKDLHPHVRWCAAHAVGFTREPRAIPLLVAALRDDNEGVRMEAASGLGWIGSKEAFEPLTAALDDADETVRKAAGEALQKICAAAG